MRYDWILFVAMCAALVLGGCKHEPESITTDYPEYRVVVYDETCVQYLMVGMGNGQAGLGPVIDAAGRPILNRECVFKTTASKEIENN